MNAVANIGTKMSSREIAELTGKRHDNVMADIRKMLVELGLATPDFSGVAKVAGSNGSMREIEIFNLPQRETLILVSGYNLRMRTRIIDRWKELEQLVAAPTFVVPQTMAEALRLAANQAEQIESQQKLIEQQAPAVEFANAIKNTSDAITISQMAAVLEIGRNRFYSQLRADHILMADNLPYQPYKDRGYFRVIESVWIDEDKQPHPTFKTLVTGRGQVFLQRKYKVEAESIA